jgi:hypothetical protein
MYDGASPFGLFGLKLGQIRSERLVKAGGWYNERGEKLGWGDLSPADFRRICAELGDDELFIVLSEIDSFASFVEKVGDAMFEVRPGIEAPGIDYVAKKCRFVIQQGVLSAVSDHHADTVAIKMGLPFRVFTRKEVRKFLAGGVLRRTLRRLRLFLG